MVARWSGGKFSTKTKQILMLLAICSVGFSVELGARGIAGSTLEVLHDGCIAIGDAGTEPACMLNHDGKLMMWVGINDCNALRVEDDGRELRVGKQLVAGGCQLEIVADSPQPTSSLSIKDALSGESLWSLRLDRTKTDLLGKTERVSKRANADLDGVESEFSDRASQLSNIEQVTDYSLATGESLYRKGLRDAAFRAFRQTIEFAQQAHLPSVRSEAAYSLAFLLREEGLLAESQAILREASRRTPAGSGVASMQLTWLEAIIQEEQSHLPEAVEMYRRVLGDASKLNKRDWMRKVAPVLANAFIELDQRSEAEALLASFAQLLEGADDCTRSALLENEAWGMFYLAQDSNQLGIQVRGEQESAKDLFLKALDTDRQCRTSRNLANIYHGLAQVAFLEHRYTEAQDWLERARPVPGQEMRNSLELLELEARLALQRMQTDEAKSLFEKLERTSQTVQNDRRLFECKVAIGKLETVLALRQSDAAVSQQASSCLDPRSSGLPPIQTRNLNRRVQSARASSMGTSGPADHSTHPKLTPGLSPKPSP